MSENAIDAPSENGEPRGDGFVEFVLDDGLGVSSQEMIRNIEPSLKNERDGEVAAEPAINIAEASPAFATLADPKLPELSKSNRAKLLLQSPNRLYFYWAVGKNPFQTLNRALGGNTGSYTLVAKLNNLKLNSEQVHAVDSEGSRWFDADADTKYSAEIGFYAVNRPFIKIIHSNEIETPRKNPSPRPASSSEWTVSADKFAQVLDVAGFAQDAFDVALAGDDWNAAEIAAQTAFSNLTGKAKLDFAGIGAEEIRYAMLAIASGIALDQLRARINAGLFAILQENFEKVSSEKALAALNEQFDFETDEILEDEAGSAVFGASLINFPRKLKKNLHFRQFAPLSSIDSRHF